MNVLITSAGRRSSLTHSFKKSTAARGAKLFAGDMDPLAPALYIADVALKLPPVKSGEYISTLLKYVQEHKIGLIVPTIDTELELLASAKTDFEKLGCVVQISSDELIEIAGDKWLTVNRYQDHGIRTPKSWLPSDFDIDLLPNELFIKPRDGSASKDAFPVDKKDLLSVMKNVPNAIIQERLQGQEITIDAFIDFSGNPIHYVPRKRIKTMGGESIQGVTISDENFKTWMIDVLHATAKMGGVGAVTLQAFLTKEGPIFSEINPRFGGGFPLALAAGGNYPEWLMKMVEGEAIKPCFGAYKIGLYMTRSYSEVFFEHPVI